MKCCSSCKEQKPLDAYSIRRASKDGLGVICKPCAAEKARQWRAANRERHRASVAVWQRENKGMVNRRSLGWRTKNPAQRAASVRRWNARNRDKRAAALARRRAKLVTPAWANSNAIGSFYRAAKALESETGRKFHVDHIVPLNSPLVCGLHCEANLQVIPATENILKRNLVWPDMP